MPPTYYQIELSARLLTVLLVILGLLLVLAFAFGYGAAWSVLTAQGSAPTSTPVAAGAGATPTPTVETETLEPTVAVRASTRSTAPPTAVPTRTRRAATRVPTRRPPTRTPTPSEQFFWVQVLASSNRNTIDRAREKLGELGFAVENQRVTSTETAGGKLHKLRIGPFPDRASADRVVGRMKAAGFSDAWIVVP